MAEPTLLEGVSSGWIPGANLGRYALVARIAVGGMAEIWLARQAGPRGFERVVVIKKVSDAYSQDPEFVEMFLDEARIAAQLSHPHIVQIYELGEEEGAYYLAMEYLPGEDLATIVRKGRQLGHPLPVPLAVRLISDAADALAHAHERLGLDGKPLNVVHRDVSPQNLLVTYDGVMKVVDFGIAKAANRSSRTMGNQLKGKLSYLSPEQARGEEIDGRADLFTLGIVAFEVLTETRLFRFDDAARALAVIGGKTPIPSIRTRNPGLPEALEWIVARALSRDLDKRYQTGREMQRDLEQWLRSQEEPAGTAEVAAYMHAVFAERINERAGLFERALRGELTPAGAEQLRPKHRTGSQASMPGATIIQRPRRRRMVPALAALGLLGAAGAGAYALWGSSSAPAPSPAPPRVAMIDVKTEPAGAQLKLDGAAQGTAPMSLELAPGSHEVLAELAGYRPASRVLRVPPGGERQQLTLTLAEIPPPPSPPPAAPAPTPAPASEAAGPAHSKPAPAPVRRGKLSLDTSPWTRVSLGGKNLGDTPLLEVPLPAGRHVLQLVNEQQGINRSVEVEIEAGKTTVKRLHL